MNHLKEFSDHQKILERVLSLLARGVSERRDAFHTATLATVSVNGEPEARTVVFRRLLEKPLALVCHVDRRSPKAAEISGEPRVSWLFYHPPEKLQLRFRTRAFLHVNDSLADEQWRSSDLFSRRCYCGAAPTTFVAESSSGLPDFLVNRRPTEIETDELGRKNFAVVRAVARELDVYELNASGHRRSLFSFNDDGEIAARWLTP